MSGIHIPGMEMPKGCAFCKISRRNGKKMVCPLCFGREEWDIRDPMSADHRLDDCPLVPVPPHGRLIDADALYSAIRTDIMGGLNYERFIKNAPTIIPADPAKEVDE